MRIQLIHNKTNKILPNAYPRDTFTLLHSKAQYFYYFLFPLYVMCESQKDIIDFF